VQSLAPLRIIGEPMEITVTHIGSVAQELLAHQGTGSILGVTSRGVYLRLACDWVTFLSVENQRGPLTLNCTDLDKRLMHVAIGEQAGLAAGKISFPASGVILDLSQASPWQAPPLPAESLPSDLRRANLRHVAKWMQARQPTSPLAGLLPIFSGDEQNPPGPPHALAPQIENLRCALAKQRLAEILAGLEGFLGLGSGLTPSGDDLTMGFLLALSRWGRLLAPGLQAEELARELLPLAHQKTTTLSANLLECASQGQADERLLFALDGMLTGAPDPPACAAALAAWGNTSGHDALVGMALLMQAPHEST
jgi:hypothetical protein